MEPQPPLILALTDDLFLAPRLEDAARALGFRARVVDSPHALGAGGPAVERRVPLTEPLQGPDAALVRALVEDLPALLLVDAASNAIPWERWIQTLKTSAATRRIPIVAFGPHVEKEELRRAGDAGADLVVSRGRLHSSLGEIIRQHARPPDVEGIRAACLEAMSPKARAGLELLNRGEYFEAHEVLEHAWMEAPVPEGYLYRSLLQIAVAYLQIERQNFPGAAKMLLRVHQWLDPIPDGCMGVDVGAVKRNLDELRQALDAAGPDGLAALDRGLLRPIPAIH